jgi:hypothetical protein
MNPAASLDHLIDVDRRDYQFSRRGETMLQRNEADQPRTAVGHQEKVNSVQFHAVVLRGCQT